MSRYLDICSELRSAPRRWMVTGAAGFIGSALVEKLLELDQQVVGVDNFVTGHRVNVDDVKSGASAGDYRFEQLDICDFEALVRAASGIDVVLHQAALGSVPRSIANPMATHSSNVTGFLNVMVAARDAGVSRVVYASSSSVYGDHPSLPKVEDAMGLPLSPYAASKRIDEMYAGVFERVYGTSALGLRYFNVFGRRQDPHGDYAAVIPRWITSLSRGEPCVIFGDGSSSRDFCYVDNAVQANLLAATAPEEAAGNVYNVGAGGNTNLLELFELIRAEVGRYLESARDAEPQMGEPRPGDVPHSQASIDKISRVLGYAPTHRVEDGLAETVRWFLGR